MAIVIIGNIVVPITGDTQKFCILIEAVAAAGIGNKTEKAIGSRILPCRGSTIWEPIAFSAGIGNKTEKAIGSQIVDPRQGSIRALNHIFHRSVIKKSVFHSENPPDYLIK